MSDSTDVRHITIVEDEKSLAELYASWLRDYEVTTAHSGEEALEVINDDTDLIFLDRRLGDMMGGEIIDELRARGHECHVVMVTRLRPDIEILQRRIDAYIEKPMDEDVIQEVIHTVEERRTYNDTIREWATIRNKIAILEDVMSEDRQEESTFLNDLREYGDQLEQKIDRTNGELDHLLVDPARLGLN